MGMFDNIDLQIDCPNPECDGKLKDFQSKDNGCILATLDFWEVNNFYDFCDKCKTWVEFNIKNRPNRKIELNDYDVIIRMVGEKKIK